MNITALYEALGADDVAGVTATLNRDVVLDVPGSHPFAGTYHGHDGLLRFVGACRSVASETIEVLDVLAGERHVAGYVLVHGDRPGRAPLENRTVHLFQLDRHGLIESIRFHNGDQASVDAFWS